MPPATSLNPTPSVPLSMVQQWEVAATALIATVAIPLLTIAGMAALVLLSALATAAGVAFVVAWFAHTSVSRVRSRAVV